MILALFFLGFCFVFSMSFIEAREEIEAEMDAMRRADLEEYDRLFEKEIKGQADRPFSYLDALPGDHGDEIRQWLLSEERLGAAWDTEHDTSDDDDELPGLENILIDFDEFEESGKNATKKVVAIQDYDKTKS